jgi:hypothetical protein
VPAPDLAHVDLTVYWTIVRDSWPTLDLQALQQLATLGKVFRRLAAMNWQSMSLEMASMRIYHAELSDAIQAIQWTE